MEHEFVQYTLQYVNCSNSETNDKNENQFYHEIDQSFHFRLYWTQFYHFVTDPSLLKQNECGVPSNSGRTFKS